MQNINLHSSEYLYRIKIDITNHNKCKNDTSTITTVLIDFLLHS